MGITWSLETKPDSKLIPIQLLKDTSSKSNWDRERIIDIFQRLDKNKNGQIDMNEFLLALSKHGVKASTIQYAQKFFDEADLNMDGEINLHEFTYYMECHEKRLRSIYDSIHKDIPGENLNTREIIDASSKFGITLSEAEAKELLKEMEIHGVVTWEIWRDFFILSTSKNVMDTLEFWRNHTIYSDVSEAGVIPKDTFHEHKKINGWWKYIVSGGLSGCISRTCTAPLDRIKVFMQTHEMRTTSKSYGIRRHFKELLEDGGWRSLWRGNGISVLKATPEYAIKCSTYEKIKEIMRGPGSSRDLRLFERFMAGSLAGGICETAIYPLELLKTRSLLRRRGDHSNIPEIIRKIYTNEGPKGFYKGYTLSLTGILPMAGMDLMMYETMKRTYLKKFHQYDEIERNSKIPYTVLVICGATSTTVGLLFTYPIVLLKTRMQATGAFNNLGHQDNINTTARKPKESKLLYNIRQIWRQSGPTGFYRGIIPCLLKVLPSVSISYLVYEKSLDALGAKML